MCWVRRLEARFGEESVRGGAFSGLFSLTWCSTLVDGVTFRLSGVFGWRAVVVVSLVGRVFLRPLGRVFGMHRYPFWYESRSNGVVFSLFSLGGLFLSVGCATPPSPFSSPVVWSNAVCLGGFLVLWFWLRFGGWRMRVFARQ